MTSNQETQEWLQSLKVGDEVAYGSNYIYPEYQFSKIKRITPTRKIIELECGYSFSKNGEEQGGRKRPRHLIQPETAKELLADYRRECEERQLLSKTKDELIRNISRMDIQQIKKLQEFIKTELADYKEK